MKDIWTRLVTLGVVAVLAVGSAVTLCGCENDSTMEDAGEEAGQTLEEAGENIDEAVDDAEDNM